MLLFNAFSLNMVETLPVTINVKELAMDEARQMLSAGFTSGVGHADTAAVFSSQLGVTVPMNRITVALKKGDVVLVGQYRGPRMPEGATTLPEGASIVWCLVTLN